MITSLHTVTRDKHDLSRNRPLSNGWPQRSNRLNQIVRGGFVREWTMNKTGQGRWVGAPTRSRYRNRCHPLLSLARCRHRSYYKNNGEDGAATLSCNIYGSVARVIRPYTQANPEVHEVSTLVISSQPFLHGRR